MALILVTGGAGYVGSVVASALMAHGHAVRILDRKQPPPKLMGAEVRVADLLDLAAVKSAVAGVDIVVHCAADSIVSSSVQAPSPTWWNNLVGTRTLLDAMASAGVAGLVNSSTAAVYGSTPRMPITEDAERSPEHAYGRSKWAVEMMITDHITATSSAAISLRYFNVAGADADTGLGERHDPETHLIPTALSAALGRTPPLSLFGEDWDTDDGTNIRDYIHVVDLARTHLIACDRLQQGHRSINVGSGRGYSNRQVLDAITDITGLDVPHCIRARRPGDPAVLRAEISSAAKELDWAPERDLHAMVTDAYRFMLEAS